MRNVKHDTIRKIISRKFPDLHWEIYSWRNGNGETVYGGFVDGWAYGLPAFTALEGDEDAVVLELESKLRSWNP